MNNGKDDVVIHGLNPMELLDFLAKKNKRYSAIALQSLEETVGKTDPHYWEIRKIILDSINNYTRAIVTVLLGDIEEEKFHGTE